jgi:septal ring factor EnvC (AmiA/AmiB activator)
VRALFGRSRNAGKLKWNGVLIKASEGKDVRAVSHGRVAYADWLRGYGLLLIVDHGDGYMSLYGHNQALYKETGEWIEAGEVIATVGQSGGQQEAALYFEIRHNGKPSNPARWCKRG